MEHKIILDEAFSQPIIAKPVTGLQANNWDEESHQSAIWLNFQESMQTGVALNFEQISKQVNAYLAKHPYEILGGEDKGNEWFKIKATLKSIKLSLPERNGEKKLRIEATINGGLEFEKGSYKMNITLYAETGIDVLKIEQQDTSMERIFNVILDGTKLGWAGAGWLPVIPLGLVAKIGAWLGFDICKKIVLKSISLPKQYQGVKLPIPSAKELFLKGYDHDSLVLLYAKKEKEADLPAQRLGKWAHKKKSLSSLALGSGYAYITIEDLIYEFIGNKTKTGSASVNLVSLDPDGSGHDGRKRYKIQVKLSDLNVEGFNFSKAEMNLYIGFDRKGNLSMRVRVKGEFKKVSFDTGVTVTISADKPQGSVQNIKVTPHIDFANIKVPWWMKFIGFFTGGLATLVLIWLVEHVGDAAKYFINKYGTMTIPNAFADYAYLQDVGKSDPDFEWWIGANLMPGTIK